MTIRKILFLTFALLVCVKMGAQTTDAEKAEKLKADNSYVTGEGYLEQGEVVTLKVNLRRHQRKVLFVTSGEIRVLRDYLIIEVDGMRILTH